MLKKLFLFLVLLGVAGVFILSWVPQPRLENYWFVPKFIGGWADAGANMNLRTAVPFVFISGLIGLWLISKSKSFKFWLYAWVFNVAVVTIAELGQLFSAHRSCDLGDILWGAAGAFVGFFLVSFGSFILSALKWIIAAFRKPVYYNKRSVQYS